MLKGIDLRSIDSHARDKDGMTMLEIINQREDLADEQLNAFGELLTLLSSEAETATPAPACVEVTENV